MLLVALSAGLVCGVVVAAFFIALDQNMATAAPTTGAWLAPPVKTTFVKRLEGVARPIVSRLGARETGQLRQKLSRAGDPGNLTPAGFQAVRYGLAALFALVGLVLGLVLRLPFPTLVVAPVAGALMALLGYMGPILWLNQIIASRRQQIQRSLAEATDLLTLVVESGLSLDEGLLSITERFHNALGDEIGKALREVRLGRPRMAALEGAGDGDAAPPAPDRSRARSAGVVADGVSDVRVHLSGVVDCAARSGHHRHPEVCSLVVSSRASSRGVQPSFSDLDKPLYTI